MSGLVVDASVWIAVFDQNDRFHPTARDFFELVAQTEIGLVAPAWLEVEVACAVARRSASVEYGRRARQQLVANPRLKLEPLTSILLTASAHLGTQLRLRSGDACYAATAAELDLPLVSWDNELIHRAGAVTPEQWLENNA